MIVKVEAYHDGEFWCAKAIGASIFTQGKTLDKLMKNIREAVSLHCEEQLNEGKTIQILLLSETEVCGVPKSAAS